MFCDSCDHDPEVVDYEEQEDGALRPRTAAGDFTILHIRLNRVALKEWRLDRRLPKKWEEAYSRIMSRLEKIEERLDKLEKQNSPGNLQK